MADREQPYYAETPDFGGRWRPPPRPAPTRDPLAEAPELAPLGVAHDWPLERLGVLSGGLAALLFVVAAAIFGLGARASGLPPRDAAGLLTWAAAHPAVLEASHTLLALGWVAMLGLVVGVGQRLHRAGSDLALFLTLAGALGAVLLAASLAVRAASFAYLPRAFLAASGPERQVVLVLFEWLNVWAFGAALEALPVLLVGAWLVPSGVLVLRTGALSRPLGLVTILAALLVPPLALAGYVPLAIWCVWAAFELAAPPPRALI